MEKRRFIPMLVLAGGLAWFFIPRLSSDWQLRHRQQLLLDAIADRQPSDLKDLIDPGYKDDWKLGKEDVMGAMDTFTLQFFALKMSLSTPIWTTIDATTSECSGMLALKGRSSNPIGEEIINRTRKLTVPTVFTWKKVGDMPWNWKLTKIQNPEVTEIPFAQGAQALDLLSK